jgi:hypothetical protein
MRVDLFPLVLTFMSGHARTEDYDRIFRGFEALYERKAKFVVLSDIREITSVPDAPTRRRIAEWSQAQESFTRQYHLGTAMIVRSAVVRGALTAINWLTRPITPQLVFTDPREGADWCLSTLHSQGLSVPREVELYCRSVA